MEGGINIQVYRKGRGNIGELGVKSIMINLVWGKRCQRRAGREGKAAC